MVYGNTICKNVWKHTLNIDSAVILLQSKNQNGRNFENEMEKNVCIDTGFRHDVQYVCDNKLCCG